MKSILIIGANSAIAMATARLYAEQQFKLYLLARDTTPLAAQAADLAVRGASSVAYSALDVTHFDQHEAVIEQAIAELGQIDLILICHGTLPEQALCEQDFDAALEAFNINALSVLSLVGLIAKHMQNKRYGSIAVVTSVAGDRGRQSNYIYGAAKGMVSIYLQGLRARLFPHNVHVIDIKPGFVDTPMTRDIKKGALWATPEQIANSIVHGVRRKKNTVYAPRFWQLIMLIVRCIPESIFKRMKL